MRREALNIQQVCSVVGLGKTLIYELIDQNRFPPGFKVGRRRLWSRKSIEEWVARSEREGVAVG